MKLLYLPWIAVSPALLLIMIALSSCGYETVNISMDNKLHYEVIPINEDSVKTANWRSDQPSNTERATTAQDYEYRLGAGDEVNILLYVADPDSKGGIAQVIPKEPYIQGENIFVVNEKGYIYIPFAGQIKAHGKTSQELHDVIMAKLKDYFKAPQLSVKLDGFNSNRITVTGEVKQQKEVFLSDEPLTVVGALSQAGGYTETADLSQVELKRRSGKTETIDLRASLIDGTPVYNPVLRDGDTLHIPRNHENRVFMLGELVTPQVLNLNNRTMTLTQGLSQARGINPVTAQPSEIYVLRKNYNLTSVYHLDASDPTAYLLGDQFLLNPRDVIFVGARPITDWSRFITQLIPSSIANLVNRGNYEQP